MRFTFTEFDWVPRKMRLYIPCMRCVEDNGHTHAELISVELRDDGRYSMICPAGHTSTTALQQMKFQVLFELAAMALMDGYTREAITGMAASLERFYEFYVRVICLKFGVNREVLDAVWKLVQNQSERQYGAYLFAAFIDRKDCPPRTIAETVPDLPDGGTTQPRSWGAFRNAVVHKGYIPSESEAFAYGNLVFLHINELIKDLRRSASEHIETLISLHVVQAHVQGSAEPIATMSIPTLVTLFGIDVPVGLEDAMTQLEAYRHRIHHR